MPPPPRIGEYRHTPGGYIVPGPNGAPLPPRMRRRFPYLSLVFVFYGVLGPAVCAGITLLFRTLHLNALLPTRLSDLPLPPSPSMDNVLFGAGVPETALAGGLVGLWLWRILWNTQVREPQKALGLPGTFPALLTPGLIFGPLLCLAGLLVSSYGVYLRTGPAGQPVPVRLVFALLSVPVMAISALFTGTIPVVLVLLGLVVGAVTAAVVALLWPQFPEEPALK